MAAWSSGCWAFSKSATRSGICTRQAPTSRPCWTVPTRSPCHQSLHLVASIPAMCILGHHFWKHAFSPSLGTDATVGFAECKACVGPGVPGRSQPGQPAPQMRGRPGSERAPGATSRIDPSSMPRPLPRPDEPQVRGAVFSISKCASKSITCVKAMACAFAFQSQLTRNCKAVYAWCRISRPGKTERRCCRYLPTTLSLSRTWAIAAPGTCG